MFSKIKQEIDSYFSRDPAIKSRLEVVLCYPGFHAVLYYRLAHKVWNANFHLFARFISNVARFLTGIEIHPGAKIGKNFFIDHGMGVVIGETASIGDNVTMYHGVTLGGVTFKQGIRHPQIGNNVVIGSGAQLLGPIHVGDGAKIGSNAVLIQDVEPGQTMVGVPARRTRKADEKVDGFSAYGTDHGAMLDPTKRDIMRLMHDIKMLNEKIVKLEGKQPKKTKPKTQKLVGKTKTETKTSKKVKKAGKA